MPAPGNAGIQPQRKPLQTIGRGRLDIGIGKAQHLGIGARKVMHKTVPGARLAALGQIGHLGPRRTGARHRVIAAAIGHHHHLGPAGHRITYEKCRQTGTDIGFLVRGGQDDAQHPWHPLAIACQRGLSSPKCRKAPQDPHLPGL